MVDVLGQDGLSLDAYLPDETIQVCTAIMEHAENLAPTSNFNGDVYPRFEAYQHLRGRLECHIRTGLQPKVSLLSTPTGGIEWVKERLRENGIDVDALDTMDTGSGQEDSD